MHAHAPTAPAGLPPPPLAKGLPLLGNSLDLFTNLSPFLLKCYRELGPIFRLRVPGQEITFLGGQEANLLFHHSGDTYFRTGVVYKTLMEEVNSTVYPVAIDGPDHSYHRRALQPGVSREAFAPFIPHAEAIVRTMAQAWKSGQTVGVMDEFLGLMLELISGAFASTPIGDHVNTIISFTSRFIGSGVAFQPKILFRSPIYQANKRTFEHFLQQIVTQHRQHSGSDTRASDFIDLILNYTYRDGRPFSEPDLLSYAHLPYVNGMTYPSRVCGYMLYVLLKHPALLEQAQAEVDAVFAEGTPDAGTLRRMKVLRGTYMETLRMYPVTTAIPRTAAQTFAYGGCRVEKGSFILVGTTLTHFLPEFYPDPFIFDVERYSEPRNEHRQPGTFAPFSFGPHACLSIGLVETLCLITMATLLHTVRLELTSPDYQIRTVVAPVPGPTKAFRVRVVAQREPRRQPAAPNVLLTEDDSLSTLLSALNADTLRDLAPRVRQVTFAPDTVIFREGDAADAFYILTDGDVAVERQLSENPAQVVARLHPGDMFGEIGLLFGGVRTATVRALNPVQAWMVDRETFLNIVNESDLTSSEIAQIVQRRMISHQMAAALPNVTPAQAAALTAESELLHIAPNTEIIQQGAPADLFYVIVRGQVEVVNHHPTGGDILLGTLGAGDYFGEAGLMQGRPRTATVRTPAESDAQVLAFTRAAFRDVIAESPATGEAIARTMCQRLIRLVQQGGQVG